MIKFIIVIWIFTLASATIVIFHPYTDASCGTERFASNLNDYSKRYYVPLLDREIGYDHWLALNENGGSYPTTLGRFTEVTTEKVRWCTPSNSCVDFNVTNGKCVDTNFWSWGIFKTVPGPGVLELWRSTNDPNEDPGKCYNPGPFPWHGTLRYPLAPGNLTCQPIGSFFVYWDEKPVNARIKYCQALVPHPGGWTTDCQGTDIGKTSCSFNDPQAATPTSSCKCVVSDDCNIDLNHPPIFYPFHDERMATIKVIYGNRVSAETPGSWTSTMVYQPLVILLFVFLCLIL